MAAGSNQKSAADGFGRRAALERMITDEPHRLRRRSISLGVHPDDADDVAQTALLRAWRSVGGLRSFEDGPLCSWLDAIARNAATDLARHRAAHPLDPILEDLVDGSDTELAVELRARLDAALKSIHVLPDSLRVPLLLHAVDGLTAPQIAEELHTTAAAVRQRITRARRALSAGDAAVTRNGATQ